jgi:Cu2+-exporting ATPase
MATPLSVTVALGRAARCGIFIRGGDALELLAKPSRLLLDKTGTITRGESALVEWTGPSWARPLVLAAEAGSRHPAADAFRRAWHDVAYPTASRSEHVHGGGVRARVGEHDVVVGSPQFVRAALRTPAPVPLDPRHTVLTPVWVAVDGVLTGRAGLGDPVREDAAAAVAGLTRRGWRVSMLSGDAAPVAQRVAADVGIDAADVVSGASPEAKLRAVEAARSEGHVVMVGDGVNDAAAIAAASVGIGVHGGAEAALATADVYLTHPGLAPVVELVDGARRTMRIVRRNIAISLVYNAVGVALAMTGTISPLIAAVMMPLSSLSVVAGAWYGNSFDAQR